MVSVAALDAGEPHWPMTMQSKTAVLPVPTQTLKVPLLSVKLSSL